MLNDYTPKLTYRAEDKFAPIPPQEAGLQTIYAEPWLKVEQTCFSDLEGTYFDKAGHLYFTEAGPEASKLHRVDIDKKEDVIVYEDKERRAMSAAKVHKDGRIFIPSVGPTFEHGYVFSVNPDGTDHKIIIEGHVIDDMQFDANGGFYYTHMLGDISDPIGGVYYVSPDFKTVTPLLDKLACPNGVAISKDGKVIWITESCTNRLIRVTLAPNGGPTDIAPFGVNVPYRFTGSGVCDSCEIDDDDNLYVSMYSQGRVMVFNKTGWPIGQILLAGREEGFHLGTTHSAIRPGTDEIYICTNDAEKGAWIFRARAFANADVTSGYQFR